MINWTTLIIWYFSIDYQLVTVVMCTKLRTGYLLLMTQSHGGVLKNRGFGFSFKLESFFQI